MACLTLAVLPRDPDWSTVQPHDRCFPTANSAPRRARVGRRLVPWRTLVRRPSSPWAREAAPLRVERRPRGGARSDPASGPRDGDRFALALISLRSMRLTRRTRCPVAADVLAASDCSGVLWWSEHRRFRGAVDAAGRKEARADARAEPGADDPDVANAITGSAEPKGSKMIVRAAPRQRFRLGVADVPVGGRLRLDAKGVESDASGMTAGWPPARSVVRRPKPIRTVPTRS